MKDNTEYLVTSNVFLKILTKHIIQKVKLYSMLVSRLKIKNKLILSNCKEDVSNISKLLLISYVFTFILLL